MSATSTTISPTRPEFDSIGSEPGKASPLTQRATTARVFNPAGPVRLADDNQNLVRVFRRQTAERHQRFERSWTVPSPLNDI
jgi:hypothetical protein